MCLARFCRLPIWLFALLCAFAFAQKTPVFTSPLPTGVRLDPAGEAVDLGSLPINLVLTPEKDRAVVVLSGWREQGIQIVDLKTRKVTQTLLQDGAFYGAAFSPNGKFIYVAEDVGDRLAVVNAATGEIAQRFPTDHYPYGVSLTANNQVFVSAWGSSTLSQFRILSDGTLAIFARS